MKIELFLYGYSSVLKKKKKNQRIVCNNVSKAQVCLGRVLTKNVCTI